MQREKRYKKIAHAVFSEAFSKLVFHGSLLYLAGLFSRIFTEEVFGIWTLLQQSVVFICMIDFGLAGGAIRNKFALLQDQPKEKQEYFNCVFFLVLGCYLVFILFLGLSKILFGWTFLLKEEYCTMFFLSLFFISLRGVFSLYHSMLYAEGQNSIKSLLEAISFLLLTALALVGNLVFSEGKSVVIFYWGFFFFLEGACFFFFLKYKNLSFQKVAVKRMKQVFQEIAPNSFLFWLQNLVSLFLFSSSSYLISRFIGLKEAGEYFLYTRPFLLILGLNFLILNPLWSSISDAFSKKDMIWILEVVKKGFIKVQLIIIFCSIVLAIFYKPLLQYWTGKALKNDSAVILLFIWTILYSSINYFSTFLNACNTIKRQVFFLALGAVIHLILSFFLVKRFGMNGVIFSGSFSLLPLFFSNIFEVSKIAKNLKQGSF